MKTDIHPPYFPKAKVHCACGASFDVGSTKEKIEVEICSNCHPFYTGEEKILDTAGRVEKFKARKEIAKEKQVVLKEVEARRKVRAGKNIKVKKSSSPEGRDLSRASQAARDKKKEQKQETSKQSRA